MPRRFYVTTPIYYVNDVPHIGHAYSTVIADAVARWHRLLGDDVWFLTGTDEHGLKVQRAAEERGLTALAHADATSDRFREAWKLLAISNDDFIRTTEPRHHEAVQTLLQAAYDNGHIEKSTYEGLYCVSCEAYYTTEELEHILTRSARLLGVSIEQEGAHEIARRSRGTPRIANRLLRRVRDVAEVEGDGRIDAATARDGLEMFGIDEMGLDKVDRSILTALCARFGGGPVGLSTLAIAVAEPPETVEDVYEPYLIQQGLLIRTPRGRVATAAAWQHLGLVPPPSALPGTVDPSLFD